MNKAIGNYRWTICGLLFFATTVNYLDRQVLSILAPDLSKEFGWTNTDYANITAVFQFVYAISLLFAGRFIDKLGTKMGYILAIIIWSVGAMMHAFAIPIGEMSSKFLSWLACSVYLRVFSRRRKVRITPKAQQIPICGAIWKLILPRWA